METVVEKLRKEIEELESQIAAHPFEGLFDKKRSDQMYQKLKKKRRELAKLEGSSGPGSGKPAETPKAAMETAKTQAPPVMPEARTSADRKAVGTASKANTGAPAKGKKTPASKAKKPGGGAQEAKPPKSSHREQR